MVLSTFGLAQMYQAVFADVGVALIAVLNSVRILKIKL
jgi:Cd2+/Zn2+-exporting ATPase